MSRELYPPTAPSPGHNRSPAEELSQRLMHPGRAGRFGEWALNLAYPLNKVARRLGRTAADKEVLRALPKPPQTEAERMSAARGPESGVITALRDKTGVTRPGEEGIAEAFNRWHRFPETPNPTPGRGRGGMDPDGIL